MGLRFHALRWIRVNSSNEVEEFIDSTRTYFKTVWADGYYEIDDILALRTGQQAKEPKTSSILSIYKRPKICYNINVRKNE